MFNTATSATFISVNVQTVPTLGIIIIIIMDIILML